jgi:hypothetical protein
VAQQLRQAVVLIHGMGEQKPMDTLRSFVSAVLSQAKPRRLFSKPDRMSETLELRRLTASGDRRRPITDFYEYYWAYQMEGTTFKHVRAWFRTLLLRSPRNVPPSLRFLWALGWMVLAVAGYLALANLLRPAAAPAPVTWTGLALLGFGALVQVFAISSLGDVARYLSPAPYNIAIRQRIRSEGIALLRKLHECGRYDRIIVVGHSLGSVIGYDILGHLWAQMNTKFTHVDRPDQTTLQVTEGVGKVLVATGDEVKLKEYRRCQRQLWLAQREWGSDWLISDFVTCGSPLANAAFLLARDQADLRARQELRELPTCPPQVDDGAYSYRQGYMFNGANRSMQILHHAALFACTRWTNIYAPLRYGFLGDWVSGPIRPAFGAGVMDIPLTKSAYRSLPLVAHTKYWAPKHTGPGEGLLDLCQSLDLDSVDWLRGPRLAAANLLPTPPSSC